MALMTEFRRALEALEVTASVSSLDQMDRVSVSYDEIEQAVALGREVADLFEQLVRVAVEFGAMLAVEQTTTVAIARALIGAQEADEAAAGQEDE